MIVIIISFLLIVSVLFVYKYKKLMKSLNRVIFLKNVLNDQLDNRFKNFEELITEARKVMDYEQTILKDVVKLRSKAKSSKTKEDEQTQYEAEGKISKIITRLDMVIKEYKGFESIPNIVELKEKINESEKNLIIILKEYNEAIAQLQKSKNTFAFPIIGLINKKCKMKYCYWNI